MEREKSKSDDDEVLSQVEQLAAAARRKFATQIAKQQRLITNLRGDLEKHGDPERWKRYGDLLLANAANAVRNGDHITVIDYFDTSTPSLEIKGDVNRSISEVAEDYFRRYTKARNGLKMIGDRLAAAETAMSEAQAMLGKVDEAVASANIEFLSSLIAPKQKSRPPSRKKKIETAFKGARRFVSSDGLEVLVGKKAVDNDYLTFRIARSLDLWLHAADHPGSHVVVRISGRKEVPNTTLLEAAQLAAFYSDARSQGKAAVRYTQKKFVNKPRRSAPGLVSLASFKTILVEPRVPEGVKLAGAD